MPDAIDTVSGYQLDIKTMVLPQNKEMVNPVKELNKLENESSHNIRIAPLFSDKTKCECIICRIKKIHAICWLRTQQAIRKGEITKQPCEICGNVKSQSHHEDYNKPLEVKWRCSKHHRSLHNYRFFSHFHDHFNPHDLRRIDLWNIKTHKNKIWFYDELIKILESENININDDTLPG